MKKLKTLTALALTVTFAAAPLAGFAAEKKEEKGKAYPLDKCVVSDEKLGEMGKPYVFKPEGREVQLCCKSRRNRPNTPRRSKKRKRRPKNNLRMPKSGLDNAPSRINVCPVKMTRAILFSLLLVWVQMVSAVQPFSPRTLDDACNCCANCKTRCCVSESSLPTSAPAPVAPVRSAAQNQLLIVPTTAALWVLPEADASRISPSGSSPLIVAGTPLYERNCALLI